MIKQKVFQLLKNVKNWVYESGNIIADKEVEMYSHWWKDNTKDERN